MYINYYIMYINGVSITELYYYIIYIMYIYVYL